MATWSVSPSNGVINNNNGNFVFPINATDTNYTVTYTDNNGCSSNTSYTVRKACASAFTVTEVSRDNCHGVWNVVSRDCNGDCVAPIVTSGSSVISNLPNWVTANVNVKSASDCLYSVNITIKPLVVPDSVAQLGSVIPDINLYIRTPPTATYMGASRSSVIVPGCCKQAVLTIKPALYYDTNTILTSIELINANSQTQHINFHNATGNVGFNAVITWYHAESGSRQTLYYNSISITASGLYSITKPEAPAGIWVDAYYEPESFSTNSIIGNLSLNCCTFSYKNGSDINNR